MTPFSREWRVPGPIDRHVADASTAMRCIRICTDNWPERDRVAMFHESVGRDRVRIQPVSDEPLRIDGTLRKLAGLGLVSVRRSALRSDFTDDSDRLMINLGGAALATQSGREFVLQRGDAIALRGAEPGSFTTSKAGRIATVEFSDGGLVPLLRNSACARRVSAQTPGLLLLRHYLNAACAADVLSTHAVRALAVAHIHDLAALALGGSREAEEIANGRGVKAARMAAIKSDIIARLEREVKLGDIAARHRVSPRYVRMLFESDGSSFTEFVRAERLNWARRMLVSRRFDDRRISDIAYDVGFNDLSYFNRTFRQRFGVSPGEARALSLPGA
jgi:AraC-like DNA-binding protein